MPRSLNRDLNVTESPRDTNGMSYLTNGTNHLRDIGALIC